ncbi:hypothetical protein KO528_17370 [Saccharophagus degradans]|uniref:hypothetical protein n=1 Tax=Saccharophagus degradans TaxID=86304 RepID=UPI001C091CB7|nr:hypothetical protein [Saccharophagus degradans]MBU2987140.1 hypothetical protein [Saccharophagus degradans]
MNFEELVSKRAIGQDEPKDYCAWAEALLYTDVESENIPILASMGYERDPEKEDIEKYFQKSLKDLKLEIPSNENGIKLYATLTIEKLLDGKITPFECVAKMEKLFSLTDYDPKYGIWDYLSEDISMLEYDGVCYFNTGLDKSNMANYIRKVAKQFLEILPMELPEYFFKLCACKTCGYIGESNTERAEKIWIPERIFRLIYGRYPASKAVCAKCGAQYPSNMVDYSARSIYLESKC